MAFNSKDEYPFDNLESVNQGDCRFCPFSVGTPTTVLNIQHLQIHYKQNHPVSLNNPGQIPATNTLVQQISPNQTKVIGVYDFEQCMQYDCFFSRDERKEAKPKTKNGPPEIVKNPNFRLLQVESHAQIWDRELTAQQIKENSVFLCLKHNNGNFEKMKELIWNYGLMYAFLDVNIKIPKIRLHSVPHKLSVAISARRLCPTTIYTSWAQIPTAADQKTITQALTETNQQLRLELQKERDKNSLFQQLNQFGKIVFNRDTGIPKYICHNCNNDSDKEVEDQPITTKYNNANYQDDTTADLHNNDTQSNDEEITTTDLHTNDTQSNDEEITTTDLHNNDTESNDEEITTTDLQNNGTILDQTLTTIDLTHKGQVTKNEIKELVYTTKLKPQPIFNVINDEQIDQIIDYTFLAKRSKIDLNIRKIVKCPKCTNTFTTPQSKNRHLKTIHR